MATERDLELLDDYLANRMQGAERSAFENKIEADPALKSEMAMQQRLVKAIRDARVAELKTMLNNTPVPPVNYGGSSAVVKFAAGTFVAGLIATGIYLYLDKPATQPPVEEQIKKTTADSNTSLSETTEEQQPVVADATESISEEPVAKTESGTKAPETTATKPEIEVFDPTESGDTEEPADERRNPVRTSAPGIAVQIESENEKYNFNYQLDEEKLVLYGPFKKDLYEVLEIFDNDKRTAFLYYQKTFYLLKDDNEAVKALVPITDQVLIKKLHEYRRKKQ